MLKNKNLERNGIGSKLKGICIFHLTVKSQTVVLLIVVHRNQVPSV